MEIIKCPICREEVSERLSFHVRAIHGEDAVLQLIVIYFTPWGETNDRLLPASTTHDS